MWKGTLDMHDPRTVAHSVGVAVLAAALTISVSTERAAAEPDVSAIMTSVSAKYAALDSYEMVGTLKIEMEAGGQKQNVDAALSIAGRPPYDQRVDIEHPLMGSLWVGNETEVVTYMKPMKRFMRFGKDDVAAKGAEMRRMGPARYAEFGDDAAGMVFGGMEAIETSSGSINCVKIEAPSSLAEVAPGLDVLSYTLWVDAATEVVRRERVVASGQNPQLGIPVKMDQTITFETIAINGPVSDALFTFSAPAGVTETTPEQLSGGGAAPEGELTGKPALPFELSTLAGERMGLDDLRGSVVLIDFWATWCGPCRRELPHVQKLYDEHKDDGLVVLAVSQEKEATIRRYIDKAGFTFPTLVDADGSVNRSYGVSALPTLVIVNREGIVSDFLVGLRSEATLRTALEKAGL
jgi:peroxiredoxin/outer membrane lipoprotein-sorting protein